MARTKNTGGSALRKRSPATAKPTALPAPPKAALHDSDPPGASPVESPNTLQLQAEPGETGKAALARTCLRPSVNAGITIRQLDSSFGEVDITSLVAALGTQVEAVKAGDLGRAEEMLLAQAQTLDTLFHQLVRRALRNGDAGYLDASETYMRLALRAQSQSRATVETLSVVKNPPSVAFVRQANIANGPQQVNNGTNGSEPLRSPPPPRARETENPQSRLLEQQRDEWMDTGTPKATGRTDSPLEAVGALNGAANARR